MRAAIVGLAGPALTDAEAALFAALPPAGVVLFARNIVDPAQLRSLTEALRACLADDAVIAVDQEGGRVARLRPPHWRPHPPCAAIGALAEGDLPLGLRAATAHGAAIGAEARAAGFDLVFAPVLDLCVDGASDVVGDRSFGANPARVAALGAAMAEGLRASGVIACGKHAPGHGHAAVDSHHALPFVPRAVSLEPDMQVFAACRDLPAMMTAHMLYEALDPDNPATLSRRIIAQYIRGHIGFEGLLVSDDLVMEALSGSAAARAAGCIAAGCDVALHCRGPLADTEAVLRAVPELAGRARERWDAARGWPAGRSADGATAAAERDALLAC